MTQPPVFSACRALDAFDPAKPCADLPDRPAPCICWHSPGHAGDHGCRCGNTWPVA